MGNWGRAGLNTQAQCLSWPNSAQLQESNRDVLIAGTLELLGKQMCPP